MSGGHFDYSYSRVEQALLAMAYDPEVKRRWPYVAARLEHLANVLPEIMRAMEWELSGDGGILVYAKLLWVSSPEEKPWR